MMYSAKCNNVWRAIKRCEARNVTMFGAQYKDVKRVMQLHEAPNVRGEQVQIHEKIFEK